MLAGCSDNSSSGELTTDRNNNENAVPISKEITLYIEDYLMEGERYSYGFTGFSGEDTLTFKIPDGNSSVNVFYPAKVGQTFQLKQLEGLEFEVLDFNREKGYVKLQVNGK